MEGDVARSTCILNVREGAPKLPLHGISFVIIRNIVSVMNSQGYSAMNSITQIGCLQCTFGTNSKKCNVNHELFVMNI